MYLNSINIYRALAITFIIAPHIFYVSDIDLNTFTGQAIYNFFTGSTANFVFISGFLFYHVFYQKNRISTFFGKKVQRLLLPYTIFSILPIVLKIKSEPEYWRNYLNLGNDGVFNDYIIPFFAYYFSGDHMIAYWYIPFAMLTFALFPLHKKFIEQRIKVQLVIVIVWYICALFIHRPLAGKLSVFHYFFYYSPIYLLGIICSQYKEVLYARLKGKEFYFLFISLILLVIPALNGSTGSSYKDFFEFNGIDLLYLQKTSFCFFFLIWLHRFERFDNKYVNIISSTSFVIYFVHGYIIQILLRLKVYLGVHFSYPWVAFIIILILLLISGALVAILVKKMLPKYSQNITGY
ncbi:acyltransferase family protein [Muriicola sp. Z0-33]|uniref:acyltransferase family protein n=1 Tax=Muriicola sp. Z0-33 TaxID=2816957 RepID=UPI0022381B82|nr:acyltransferase [Muriicola sp. Z0-33]MCW5514871.1 acyltransferase [Muriicola sp. Z0-33]